MLLKITNTHIFYTRQARAVDTQIYSNKHHLSSRETIAYVYRDMFTLSETYVPGQLAKHLAICQTFSPNCPPH